MEHPDESFYELPKNMDFEYNDAGVSLTTYTIIHIASGYSMMLDEEMPVICTIYKQDKELITIDTSDYTARLSTDLMNALMCPNVTCVVCVVRVGYFLCYLFCGFAFHSLCVWVIFHVIYYVGLIFIN